MKKKKTLFDELNHLAYVRNRCIVEIKKIIIEDINKIIKLLK